MNSDKGGLSNPATFDKFRRWMESNCADRDQLDKIDIEAEFGKDLTCSEAIELAIRRFPTLWKAESESARKPKQIVFVKDLVKKISEGKVRVTYRKSPKVGTYYVIADRFRESAESSKVVIEFYQTDRIDPYRLTDEEAKLAGVDTAEEIRKLFEKWYGRPAPMLYRNWFRSSTTEAI